MARRKAPQRRCQGASKGSLQNKANPQPAGEPKTASQKKRFLQVILLLAVALAGGYCRTSLPANAPALWFKERQNLELLLEEAAQLWAEISSTQKAVSKMAFHVSPEMSDWALKSSGATIDTQRTSESYSCRLTWGCRVVALFFPSNPPDAILQPDVSPGNRWCFQGHQGQVVIRLPAGVHLAAVTLQHVYKEASPSGSVASAPRDFAVFGVDTEREEETLLGIFMYDVTKEAIQTFPLKNMPFPRAFSRVKFLVKSNWGNPAYTCIYRVQVHGVMAKPESLD
ncbi:unnamed protein product [Bubo scandiacus]